MNSQSFLSSTLRLTALTALSALALSIASVPARADTPSAAAGQTHMIVTNTKNVAATQNAVAKGPIKKVLPDATVAHGGRLLPTELFASMCCRNVHATPMA